MWKSVGMCTRSCNAWGTIALIRQGKECMLKERSLARPAKYARSEQSFATKSNEKKDKGNDDAGPIRYMQSPAAKWTAKQSRTGLEMDRLWYEPFVIIASITVFMIYFCVLREESDIDLELGKSLYSRVPGLEKIQLQASLKHNQARGLPTKDIEDRLKQLGK